MRGTALPFIILTRSHLPGLSVELGYSTEIFMFFPCHGLFIYAVTPTFAGMYALVDLPQSAL